MCAREFSLLSLVVLLATGCDGTIFKAGAVDGPDHLGADPFNAGAADLPGDAGAAPDAGPAGVDGSDGGTDGGMALPPPTKFGGISISQGATPPTNYQCLSSLVGQFGATPANPSCTSSKVGSCFVSVCSGSSPPIDSESAGTISVAGTQPGLTLTYNGGGAPPTLGPYAWETVGAGACNQLWGGGGTLTMSSTGDTVPAFSGTLPAPGDLGVSASLTISRSSDYTFSWSSNSAATVDFESVNGSSFVDVNCEFATSPATVPAAALAALKTMGEGYSGMLFFYSVSATTVRVGDYAISLRASSLQNVGGNATISD
jgi:hypothetical protein